MEHDDTIEAAASALVTALLATGKTMAAAESCTGGWVAKAVTDVPGSSGCFGCGIVSYSNDAKEALLDVDPSTLREEGAVSEAVVREMASGALSLSCADLAVAISGIAGPGGGSPEKPVGTVWFCWAARLPGNEVSLDTALHRLAGGRDAVRRQSVLLALNGLRERSNG
jgi:nicotinamide-nucleotide amidase